jgi:hypothetical protein
MLARKWSLVSWSDACSPSRMWPGCSVASIDATAGLQTSQPVPVPNLRTRSRKVAMPVTRRIS